MSSTLDETRRSLFSLMQESLDRGLGQVSEADMKQQVDNRESAMRAASEKTKPFFTKHLPKLLELYPELDPVRHADDVIGQQQQAEEAAIKELVAEIQHRLARARVRGSDAVVGPDEAARAVSDPRHRILGNTIAEGRDGPYMTWDEVGRYHTALRAIFCDGGLEGHYTTQYFDGIQGYTYAPFGTDVPIRLTYRRALALLWKGASEPEETFQRTVSDMDTSVSEVREKSIDQFISELASNRREHNNDTTIYENFNIRDLTPEERRALLRGPDRQSCDKGTNGRLFGQMLKYNDRYQQTQQDYNFELLIPVIRQLLQAYFIQLDDAPKLEMLQYLEDMIYVGETETDCVQGFMDNFTQYALARLGTVIQTDARFSQIKTCLHNLTQGDRDPTGQNELQFRQALEGLVRCEAESVQMTANNPIDQSTFEAMVADAVEVQLRDNFEEKVAGFIDEFNLRIKQIAKRIKALQRVIDSEMMRAQSLPEYGQSDFFQQKKGRLVARVEYYQRLAQVFENKLNSVLDRVQTETVQSATALSQHDTVWRQQVIRPKLVQIQQQLATTIAPLEDLAFHLQCEEVHAKLMRDHIRDIVMEVDGGAEAYQTPQFLARYVWQLLLEKSDSGDYYLLSGQSDRRADTLDGLLKTIFGDTDHDIDPKSTAFISVFLAEINKIRHQHSHTEEEQRWQVIKDRLLEDYNIQLESGIHAVPVAPERSKVHTLVQCIGALYQIPQSTWSRIIERSRRGQHLMAFDDTEDQYITETQLRRVDTACKLSLSFANAEGIETQTRAQQERNQRQDIWEKVAKSIWQNAPGDDEARAEALANFVTLTLLRNLRIDKLSSEDQKHIICMVKQYMHVQTYQNFALMFEHLEKESVDDMIHHLATHMSTMITTLSPPSVSQAFSHGIIRLMSRYRAERIRTNEYVLRMSNSRPWDLALSCKGYVQAIDQVTRQPVEKLKQYHMLLSQFAEVQPGVTSYTIPGYDGSYTPSYHHFPDTTLTAPVTRVVGTRRAVNADVRIEQMSDPHFQEQAQAVYRGYSACTYSSLSSRSQVASSPTSAPLRRTFSGMSDFGDGEEPARRALTRELSWLRRGVFAPIVDEDADRDDDVVVEAHSSTASV